MKIAKTLFWGILLLYCNIFWAEKISLLGIIPNLLLPFIIYSSVYQSERFALSLSFFFGLALDLIQPHFLGMHALAFTVISIIVIKLHESINKRRLFMVSLCTLILNFIFYTIFIFYYFIFAVDMTRIAAGFFVSVFYNSFLTIILIYFFLFINRLKLSIDV